MQKQTAIYDIRVIRKQYKTGLSIRSLSKLYKIPYATLYRELKGRKKELSKQTK